MTHMDRVIADWEKRHARGENNAGMDAVGRRIREYLDSPSTEDHDPEPMTLGQAAYGYEIED